ncbi:MAG: hypothetical protein FJX44_06320 [Alphaproteobacteria bacterium]|nr:hypothetical protein [Alphaproteobacteria bacterium]
MKHLIFRDVAASAATLILCTALQLQLPVLAQSDELRVGGSTTLVPSVVNAASTFMETYETWDQAGTSLPAQQTIIYVTGGGSGFGVKSATNGIVDIGMVSRDLKDKEKDALGKYEAVLVGKDAVAIATKTNNPLAKLRKDLSTDEVRKLFSGTYKTYKDFDPSLPDQEIVLLVRDASAGSAEIFQDKIMGETQVSPGALQMPSQGALVKKLESNPNALVYMSSGLANDNANIHSSSGSPRSWDRRAISTFLPWKCLSRCKQHILRMTTWRNSTAVTANVAPRPIARLRVLSGRIGFVWPCSILPSGSRSDPGHAWMTPTAWRNATVPPQNMR